MHKKFDEEQRPRAQRQVPEWLKKNKANVFYFCLIFACVHFFESFLMGSSGAGNNLKASSVSESAASDEEVHEEAIQVASVKQAQSGADSAYLITSTPIEALPELKFWTNARKGTPELGQLVKSIKDAGIQKTDEITEANIIVINPSESDRYKSFAVDPDTGVKRIWPRIFAFCQGCIGCRKQLQLECRNQLAEAHGCAFADLGISPPQFYMRAECEVFFEFADKNRGITWIEKPASGSKGMGHKVHKELPQSFMDQFRYEPNGAKKCRNQKGYKSLPDTIMMEYIADALLLKGAKFDARVYLLVARVQPYVVFYSKGFVRRSNVLYDKDSTDRNVHITNVLGAGLVEDHYWSFDMVAEHFQELDQESGNNEMTTKWNRFMNHAKHSAHYAFQAARQHIPQGPKNDGRYQLFALDLVPDAEGNAHLLEGNGLPLVKLDRGKFSEEPMYSDMFRLVTTLQLNPRAMGVMRPEDGYSFGRWELLYNQKLEMVEGEESPHRYNPCEARKYRECRENCVVW